MLWENLKFEMLKSRWSKRTAVFRYLFRKARFKQYTFKKSTALIAGEIIEKKKDELAHQIKVGVKEEEDIYVEIETDRHTYK